MVMVEKVVVMNCHVQQKVKVGKTVCDEASVVPWEVVFYLQGHAELSHSKQLLKNIHPMMLAQFC